jgi:hypothetical protein
MSAGKIIIAIILIGAAIAILLVALPAMGITLPPAVWTIFGIVIIAAAACVAITFLWRWWSQMP